MITRLTEYKTLSVTWYSSHENSIHIEHIAKIMLFTYRKNTNPVFKKGKWKAKLTAYKGNMQLHSSQPTRTIMPKLTSYNGNNDRTDIMQEVTDGQVVRALVSVAWKCTVMIWRSWVWTLAGANLGCVVLLSQVVLEPKIIMTKLTAQKGNNEKADSIQG